MTELDFVFARELANALELIWEFLDQVISGPDGLGYFRGCSRLVLTTVVETDAGCVQGCLMVMAQFIFTTASFSLEGRARMAGPGVSAMYQYDFILCGASTRAVWLPSDGSSECTI